MNYSGFLHLLNDEVISNKDSAKKHIIRFRNHQQYHQCRAYLTRLQPTLSKLSSIQSVKMICAFLCCLRSIEKFAKYRGILFIEEDLKISVNAFPAIQPISRTGRRILQIEQRVPWGVKEIKAPQLWNYSMGNHVKIGVIDTGVDYSHPDLRSCLSRGINLVHRNTPPFDDNGHGTHIIGTIAAANQSNGVIGVAPRAAIHPVKAFDHNGSAYVSDIILGIDWSVRNRMNIINMSFGMKNRSQSLFDAVRNAYRSGVTIVASSGNDGNSTSVDYPARFTQTISVGATTRKRRIAPFSNRGKNIDVYAPGDKIVSTWLGGKYNVLSGTSMATSHVSGTIALVLSVKPGLTPGQLKLILKQTVTPINESARKSKIRKGQIDAARFYKQFNSL